MQPTEKPKKKRTIILAKPEHASIDQPLTPLKKKRTIILSKLEVPPPVLVPLVIKEESIVVASITPLDDVIVPNIKRTIKLQKPQVLPVITEPITLAKQAFLNLIEYYKEKKLPVPPDDIKWFHEELQREKKEDDEFWERCAVTKVCMEGVLRGDDEWTIQLAENAARQKVKALPIQESDIGPMPEHGTKEFWAWCNKKKKLKEQKDAAIIAAGGKIKEKKSKK